MTVPGRESGGPSEEDLARRLQSGDTDALGLLYERSRARLEARVRRSPEWKTLREHLATPEDVVSQTWLRVLYRGTSDFRYRGPGSFEAWIGTFLDRERIDLVRRLTAQKRGGGSTPASLDTQADRLARRMPGQPPATTPTGAARRTEHYELLRQVLSEDEFLVWHLHEIEGLALASIAARLGRRASEIADLLKSSAITLLKRFERDDPT